MSAIDLPADTPLLNWSEQGVSELPTGTVTLLLADVEGSTRLWETQSDTMTTALEHLNHTVDELVAAHGGVRPVEQGARRWADDTVAAAPGGHRIVALTARARVALAQGEPQQAESDLHDAVAVAERTGGYLRLPDALECLAALAADTNPEHAARLFGAVEGMRKRHGEVRFKAFQAAYDTSLAAVRKALGQEAFDAAWSEGNALSTGEAISYAQRGRGARGRPASGWESLTPTERDVVRLVIEGLPNKDIAARLFISPRTVQSHLTHVYSKLAVSSRVQLVQEAARHT